MEQCKKQVAQNARMAQKVRQKLRQLPDGERQPFVQQMPRADASQLLWWFQAMLGNFQELTSNSISDLRSLVQHRDSTVQLTALQAMALLTPKQLSNCAAVLATSLSAHYSGTNDGEKSSVDSYFRSEQMRQLAVSTLSHLGLKNWQSTPQHCYPHWQIGGLVSRTRL